MTEPLRSGIMRFFRQLEILEERTLADHAGRLRNPSDLDLGDVLELDVETYYTVAHDLLKLVSRLLSDDERKRFESEPTYKHLAAIRTHLIRHAYGSHPKNNPFPGRAWHSKRGLILRAGSSLRTVTDKGFFANRDALHDLVRRYKVGDLATAIK